MAVCARSPSTARLRLEQHKFKDSPPQNKTPTNPKMGQGCNSVKAWGSGPSTKKLLSMHPLVCLTTQMHNALMGTYKKTRLQEAS